MNFTSADKQNMQLNPKHIPSPTVNERLSYSFHVSIGMEIAYGSTFVALLTTPHKTLLSFCQILENEKLLLVLIDRDRVSIYLDRLAAIDMAIRRNRPIKAFNREKLGQDVLFAFDESKRVLAVCSSTKVPCIFFPRVQVSLFVISCTFTCTFLMRPSRHSRDRGVLSTLPRGIAKLGSPFYK